MPQTPNNAPTYKPPHNNNCHVSAYHFVITQLFKVYLHPIKKIVGSTTNVHSTNTPTTVGYKIKLLRKEVIQPHLPVRLPCYDFVPIADPTFDSSLTSLSHWLRVLPTFMT